ncbi:hypothetical protein G7Y89_g13984 [Cudoniella acicularis]|uniref:CBF1-interacting co-repressor CIR N-terminal domain-containing protein n=1 Tax=Cudoniella acicularis TaxID=354080 RepID=A0A8H4R8G9_9HELO|nr:hypothetical protein G7Y89_g13984 [Cudoniella acicularis]
MNFESQSCLCKKSWNVYNQVNIEKVKRDEAIAKAKEEAEEQRMQELDAERRIQILRGEIPTPLPEIEDKADEERRESRSYGGGRERKRRKKAGENDTDFEMRVASEQTASSNTERQIVLRKPIDVPLVDHTGHIDLFPQERSQKVEKNAEAEKEAAKKKKEYEDQYTMRFSNAAGFKQGLENPWYSKTGPTKEEVDEMPGKDVWGNEDPRRKEREAARIVSNDPLAMMRQGAAQVRQVEKERKRWREEKERELAALEAEERRRKNHKRKHDDDDDDDLEDFSLDKPGRSEESSRRRHDDRERRERKHRHRHRSSRAEEEGRHRHRHKDRERD